MYLVTVLRNLLIILAISTDSHLHTPMYFFLFSLSLVDICFISTTVPKMIVDILSNNRVISYEGCLTQMSVFLIFASMDDMLLIVMAYDRFVAICNPLHYTIIVNPHRWKTINMEAANHTGSSQFILLGLSEDPKLQPFLFGLSLSIYLLALLRNLLIVLAVSCDSHLHTPMYFFLSNLSFVDICFISSSVPKMLVNIQAHSKDISYRECLTQVYFLMVFFCNG
ncbi:Olfactory receptor 7E24 [Fukomys damarensis]|uniref:Olfactory receptor 7E24 n=1 Tax=Fukomys damarensis TaxID=885580 RepID=A0A091DI46_FUKDA|nr:Olfactory receptor 7E24 [Fukomys damarensis]